MFDSKKNVCAIPIFNCQLGFCTKTKNDSVSLNAKKLGSMRNKTKKEKKVIQFVIKKERKKV